MAQYCDKFRFTDADNDSFEFWNGLRGPAGPAGPQGPQGPQGPKGDPGPGAVVDPTLTISGDAADAKAAGDAIRANAAELAQQKSAIATKAGALVDTASGAIASFVPDDTIGTLVSIYVDAAGSTTVHASGANIWDEQWVRGSIDSNGADIASSNGIRSANYCRCAGDTEYSFVKPAGITARVYWYDKTNNYISRSSAPREGSQAVITSPANAFWYRIQVGDSSYRYPTYNNDIALFYPATETEYLPHVGSTYTVQAGQVVTPTQIAIVHGQQNNVFADAGNVTVEYAADLITYIDQKIAAAVAALS